MPDLKNDPNETKNGYTDSEYKADRQRMMKALNAQRDVYDVPDTAFEKRYMWEPPE